MILTLLLVFIISREYLQQGGRVREVDLPYFVCVSSLKHCIIGPLLLLDKEWGCSTDSEPPVGRSKLSIYNEPAVKDPVPQFTT